MKGFSRFHIIDRSYNKDGNLSVVCVFSPPESELKKVDVVFVRDIADRSEVVPVESSWSMLRKNDSFMIRVHIRNFRYDCSPLWEDLRNFCCFKITVEAETGIKVEHQIAAYCVTQNDQIRLDVLA